MKLADEDKRKLAAFSVAQSAINDQLRSAMQKQPNNEVDLRTLELTIGNCEFAQEVIREMMDEILNKNKKDNEA